MGLSVSLWVHVLLQINHCPRAPSPLFLLPVYHSNVHCTGMALFRSLYCLVWSIRDAHSPACHNTSIHPHSWSHWLLVSEMYQADFYAGCTAPNESCPWNHTTWSHGLTQDLQIFLACRARGTPSDSHHVRGTGCWCRPAGSIPNK